MNTQLDDVYKFQAEWFLPLRCPLAHAFCGRIKCKQISCNSCCKRGGRLEQQQKKKKKKGKGKESKLSAKTRQIIEKTTGK